LPRPVLALALACATLLTPAVTRADQTFSNSAAININDSNGTGPAAADLYPSQISVSGVTGSVTAVTATLHGFAHSCPQDVDVLLVGPEGDNTVLMSDAGDCTSDMARAPIDLSFDDSASAAVPCNDTTELAGGTYRPANYEDHDCVNPGDFPDTFPTPAPAGPWGSDLSGFTGKNPDGTWSLYVVDDQNGDAGAIHGGWSLSIATATPPAPASQPQPPAGPQPPVISSKTKLTQNVLKTHGVVVSFSSSRGGSLVASGTVSVPNVAKTYRFTTVRKNVTAGAVQVKLKLPRAAFAAVKRALKQHRRLSAKITLALTGADGAKISKKLAVRLK
jgi:hypothetical protein